MHSISVVGNSTYQRGFVNQCGGEYNKIQTAFFFSLFYNRIINKIKLLIFLYLYCSMLFCFRLVYMKHSEHCIIVGSTSV